MRYATAYLNVVSWTPCLPDDLILPTKLVPPSSDEANLSAIDKGSHVSIALETSHAFHDYLRSTRSLYTTMRSNLPFDERCEVYYCETHVIDLLPSHHIMGIGIHADFETDLYGASCTYMNNATMSYRGFGMVSSVWPYGTTYGAGDVIGCGFRKSDRSLFFTRNGTYLGSAIPQDAHGKYSGINVKGPAAFYPQLRFASRTFTADIRVNFGQEPFRFDIIKYCELLGNPFSKFKRDATNLPSEILHKILTLAVSTHPDTTGTVGALQPADTPRLDESHLGLSRLALVCRHWARHSRTALYRSVILHHQEQVERFKHLILKSPQEWYPGLFIQLLGAVDAASPEIGLLLLSTLPRRLERLRTLIWGERKSLDNSAVVPRTAHNRYPPQFLVLMPSLFQAFSALQFLTLRGLRFSSFSRFARLICSITKLETLGIDDVHWPEAAPDLDTPPVWFRRPRLLRRVETANMDSIGSSSCMGDIAWFFVGRLSPTPSHHSSPLRSDGLLLPHFDELDATIIPRILMSVATRQYEDHRDSSDGGFSSAYIISMEDKHEPRAGWELTVRNTAADTGWTLALRLSRSTSVPCRHSAIQEITVWLHSARSESSFHLFCADLDAAVINLSNFPNLRCQFYESSGTAAARKTLSKVSVYMPNLPEDMLVVHGAKDDSEDEETRPAEQMTAFPSHYWLGDYDTPPARQNASASHVLSSGQPSTSAAVRAVQGQALLENDMTMVGYSY